MTSSEIESQLPQESGADASSGLGAGRVALIVIALVVLVLVLRVISSGTAALERGDAAHAQGDHLGAAVAWRASVSWTLPVGASWRVTAMDRLERLADEREAAGDLSGAVMALSSLRSGILGGHGLWRPDEDRLTQIDGRLAPMMARWAAEDASENGRVVAEDRESREAFFAAHLARDVRPSRGMSLLAMVGFLVWLGGMYRAARVQGASRVRAALVSVIGLGSMLIGVALA